MIDPARRARAASFDSIAELYGEARPGYPAPLIADVAAYAALGPGRRVLEIGPGPGTATLPFAETGCDMVCVEPGERLAEVLRARTARYPGVRVVVAKFEEWPLEPDAFDLVLAASSWHWVDPAVGYPKAQAALQPGGAIALCGNVPGQPEGPVNDAIQAAYDTHAPELSGGRDGSNTMAARVSDREARTREAADWFEAVEWRRYPWTGVYDAESYIAYIATHSNHVLLPEPARDALYGGIREAVLAHGNRVAIPYTAMALLGRRAAT